MRIVRNVGGVNKILGKARRALLETAVELRDDLRAAGTMPFESGHLQDAATFVEVNKRGDVVSVVSDTVYARRKYFNPQFDFDRRVNRRAGGRWFDVYLTESSRDFVYRNFVRKFRI